MFANFNEITNSSIKPYISSLKDAHLLVNSVYYIPSLTSRAINKNYLVDLLKNEETCPVFRISRNEVKLAINHVAPYNCEELLNILENILLSKGFKSSGLTIHTLPNKDWLLNMIYTLDPIDSMNLFTIKSLNNQNKVIDIDPKFFFDK